MRLTIEEDRGAIQRYAHVPRARPWQGPACGARCPGTIRRCSLPKGHTGLHVAHGRLRRVLAVWDEKAIRDAERPGGGPPAKRRRRPAEPAPWKAVAGRLVPSPHTIEAVFLLVLTLSMVGFGIQWILKIIGGVT